VTEVSTRMRFSYGTVPLYGVAWSPTHHTILAAGSHDGKILVFNSALSQRHLIHELYGNAAKVVTVAWSVLNRGLIAGASDDAVCYLCCGAVWAVLTVEFMVIANCYLPFSGQHWYVLSVACVEALHFHVVYCQRYSCTTQYALFEVCCL
jgi:WD40 repeat protein